MRRCPDCLKKPDNRVLCSHFFYDTSDGKYAMRQGRALCEEGTRKGVRVIARFEKKREERKFK